MTDKDRDNAFLEEFFAAARADAPVPPAVLIERVAADAPRPARPAREKRQSWTAQVLSSLGGWGGIGGMATAAAAGVWIGYAGLGEIGAFAASLWGDSAPETIELMPGAEVFALAGTEG